MRTIKIAYFGTPYFSARFLEKLVDEQSSSVEIIAVVTRPDQPVGRNRIMTPSPVKQTALSHHLPVIVDLKDPQLINILKQCDFAFLFAYGGFIPRYLLTLPRLGFLNTHPSLLPKYRGPAPMAYPLILGDTQTGATLIRLDEKIDHGPIFFQESKAILLTDRRPDLEVKLADLSYELFKKLILRLSDLSDNKIRSQEQSDTDATVTRQFTKEDGFIPFSTLKKAIRNEPLNPDALPKIIIEYINTYGFTANSHLPDEGSAKVIYNLFRGLYPWPGIWTLVNIKGQEKRLKITELSLQPATCNLQLIKVQLEGKNEVDFMTFNNAYGILK